VIRSENWFVAYLKLLNDFNVVEKSDTVQSAKGRIVQRAWKHNVLEILQPKILVNASQQIWILKWSNLFELNNFAQEFSMVGFVSRQVWVVL
jgi:hypothetical protein